MGWFTMTYLKVTGEFQVTPFLAIGKVFFNNCCLNLVIPVKVELVNTANANQHSIYQLCHQGC